MNAASEYPLDASRVEPARRLASGGRLLEVGIGPAGTAKTKAMRAFARAIEAGGGRVLAQHHGATIRLLGDPAQVAAVESGAPCA